VPHCESLKSLRTHSELLEAPRVRNGKREGTVTMAESLGEWEPISIGGGLNGTKEGPDGKPRVNMHGRMH